MKRRTIVCFALFVFVLLLVGCQPTQPQEETQTQDTQPKQEVQESEPEPEPEVPEPLVPEPTCTDGIKNQGEEEIDCGGPNCEACPEPEPEVPDSYELMPSQETQMAEKLTKGTMSTFMVNTYPKGLKVGESYVFAHGITVLDTFVEEEQKLPTEFRYSVIFKEARNSKNNLLETEEQTVMSWFSINDFPTNVLDDGDQQVIPVGVTVGKYMAPGVDTEPGTYYFELLVEYDVEYRYREFVTDEFSFRVVE